MDRRSFCLTLLFSTIPTSVQTWLIPFHEDTRCHYCDKQFKATNGLIQVWRHHDNFLYCCEEEARRGAPAPNWGALKPELRNLYGNIYADRHLAIQYVKSGKGTQEDLDFIALQSARLRAIEKMWA
jgi:hypothetical protein